MTLDTAYLKKRGYSWSFYLAVPRDLRGVLGKAPITKALGTRDLSLAQQLRWEHREHWEKEFQRLRGAPVPRPTESPREVYREMLSYASLVRNDELSERRERLIDRAVAEARELDDNGHPLDISPELEAQILALNDEMRRRKTGRQPKRPKYEMTISEGAERFLRRVKADDLNPQTIAQYRMTLGHFSEHLNDKPLSTVTKQDVGRFVGVLEVMSKHWGKSPQDKALSFSALVEKYANRGQPISDRTINRHLAAIRGLWGWAEKAGEVEGLVPLEGLHRAISKKRDKEGQYRAFSPEEVVLLFGLPRSASLEIVEIALVGLYSGMRLEEIVLLEWENVTEIDGIMTFDITKAKSFAGVRQVPIHSQLSWLTARTRTTGLLWPQLVPKTGRSRLASTVSKRFSTFREAHGFPSGGKKVFHSLRKTFVSQLLAARVTEPEVAQIVGHEHDQITASVYNPGGFSLQQCKENVERFRISGLDPFEVLRLHKR